MAAGASGVDLVMLVVAADEGVMPQTREHLDICRLLGVSRGVVVVTKSDLLPGLGADWLPLLEEEIRAACAGTFLEAAAIVPVSARTGEGLPRLVEVALRARRRGPGAPRRRAAPPAGGPGLHAEGVRHRGHRDHPLRDGLRGGCARARAPVARRWASCAHAPCRSTARRAPRASAGQRTAVNLPGVEATAISRGQSLAHPGVVPPTSILDVEILLLEGAPRPIRHRSRLLLHVGTAQVPCAVALVDGRPSSRRGAPGFAQLRLAAPVAALPGQRFILRGFRTIEGRGKTVGGGRVLAILPRKRRRGRPENAGAAPDPRRRTTPTRGSPWCSRWPGRPGSAPTR